MVSLPGYAMLAAYCHIVGIILAALHWMHCESRYPEIFPQILKTLVRDDWIVGSDERKKLRDEARIKLGAYEPTAIPMYIRHLREQPDSTRFAAILQIVERIGSHHKAFLPFAIARLPNSKYQFDELRFITKYGGPMEANAVAKFLLLPDFRDEDPRSVLKCLQKIGGKAETVLLTQYIVDQIASDPKQRWVEDAEDCRSAIQLRLEAQDKALVVTPYRHIPELWRNRRSPLDDK